MALDGLKGVKTVRSGFKNNKEINTVFYDPTIISIEEMENALKKAGTARVDINAKITSIISISIKVIAFFIRITPP